MVGRVFVEIMFGTLAVLAEIGVEAARFDEDDVDAEFFDFKAKNFTRSFKSKFGGGVDAVHTKGEKAVDGTDIDDSARTLFPHRGEDGPCDTEGAVEVGVKLCFNFIDSEFFNRA